MDNPTFYSIVGARPNFVKLAALSPEIRKVANEVIIHTGQHYDYEMSKAFFDEMGIPAPDFHLGIGSGPHGKQTGNMLYCIEKVLSGAMEGQSPPSAVIVYGDTNSTLAGALAAAKMHVPVIHIEAGARSFDKRMPEEINRIIVDHVSSMMFCSTLTGYHNLAREGLPATNIYARGDVMVDLLQIEGHPVVLDDVGEEYNLLTIHREENTSIARLKTIFRGLSKVSERFIFPCHPRIRKCLPHLHLPPKIVVMDPVGYFEMREYEKRASRIVTDSGGVQKEAYLFKVPCITLRDNTEWVETLEGGWNVLTGADSKKICKAFDICPTKAEHHSNLFGKPGVCKVISRIISEEFHG